MLDICKPKSEPRSRQWKFNWFCLVYFRAQNLSDILNAKGWPAAYISGSQEQVERLAAMAKLKQVACRVLISTDLVGSSYNITDITTPYLHTLT